MIFARCGSQQTPGDVGDGDDQHHDARGELDLEEDEQPSDHEDEATKKDPQASSSHIVLTASRSTLVLSLCRAPHVPHSGSVGLRLLQREAVAMGWRTGRQSEAARRAGRSNETPGSRRLTYASWPMTR